jgi:hypothetical protein
VSTQDQDLALQIDALIRCGVANELIFTDKASGAKHQRPGLDTCLDQLQAGDTGVIREVPGTDYAKAVAERAAPEPPVELPIEDEPSADEPPAAPRPSGRQRRLFDEEP